MVNLQNMHDNTSLIKNTEPFQKENESSAVNSTSTNKKINLPLISALKSQAQENSASFHFPGHNKGQAAPETLTQLIGVKPFHHDFLFSPEGPISDAQKLASKLFGAKQTWFLYGGTTCGIQAAIMATCSPGSTLILPRNSHISAISGLVLSGALPKYIVPQYDFVWDIPGGITVSQIENAVKELEMEGKKPAAVFVTSPTYHGICSNLTEISSFCHSLNVPMIVDEAHGAHLGFHRDLPASALSQGADISIQSTHKVLCSLQQSSMLHMSTSSIVDSHKISRCLQTLQSTSPSYLLLASLDAARAQLSENPNTIFNRVIELALEAKNLINNIKGISTLDFPSFSNLPAFDPLRLTIGVWDLGLSGYEAYEILDRDYGIAIELSGTKSITLPFNLGTCREHVNRLVVGLKHLSDSYARARLVDLAYIAPFEDIITHLNPREAFFCNKREVAVEDSIGEICGELILPFPPGIPLLFPGERITKSALDYLFKVKSEGAVIRGAADPLLSSIVVCSM